MVCSCVVAMVVQAFQFQTWNQSWVMIKTNVTQINQLTQINTSVVLLHRDWNWFLGIHKNVVLYWPMGSWQVASTGKWPGWWWSQSDHQPLGSWPGSQQDPATQHKHGLWCCLNENSRKHCTLLFLFSSSCYKRTNMTCVKKQIYHVVKI